MLEIPKQLINALKHTVLDPKARFEAFKKSTVRVLVAPLIGISTLWAVSMAAMGIISGIEASSADVMLRIIGGSSGVFSTMAATVGLTVLGTIGANLYYSRQVEKSFYRLEALERGAAQEKLAADTQKNYDLIRARIDEELRIGQSVQLQQLVRLLQNTHSAKFAADHDLMSKLINTKNFNYVDAEAQRLLPPSKE